MAPSARSVTAQTLCSPDNKQIWRLSTLFRVSPGCSRMNRAVLPSEIFPVKVAGPQLGTSQHIGVT